MAKDRTLISFDYAIKNVLRDKSNFGILSGFLTELIGKKITVQEILESESNKDTLEGKVNRLDLKAKVQGGELAVFEIQFSDPVDFFGKVLYNACKSVAEQISAGDKYNIKKVYSINIAYFNLGAKRDYVLTAGISHFTGIHFKEKILFSNEKELVPPYLGNSIHPEYYLILPNNFDERIRGKFDEWVYMLKNSAVRSDFTAAGIKQAAQRLDLLKMTPEERLAYENYLINRTNLESSFEAAKAEGELIGEARGIEKGKAEGEAIGVEKGELKAKLEIAKKLKAQGLEESVIYDVIGLPKGDFLMDSKKPMWKVKKKR